MAQHMESRVHFIVFMDCYEVVIRPQYIYAVSDYVEKQYRNLVYNSETTICLLYGTCQLLQQ